MESFEKLGIQTDENSQISHTETWSLICSSLTYARTIGPIWYFIRKTDNIKQLQGFLKRRLKQWIQKNSYSFQKTI